MSDIVITDPSQLTDETLDQIVDRFQNHGATFKEIKGISDDELEAMYALAHGQLQNGRFEQAETMFRFLCLNDHLSHKYWLAMGICLKEQEKFEEAVNALGVAGLLNMEDPRAAFAAAECHVRLGNRTESVAALESAISFAGDKPEFAATRQRAEMMLKVLNQSNDQDS